MTLQGTHEPQSSERLAGDGGARLDDAFHSVPRRKGALTKLTLTLFGIGLAYLVISHTLVAYLADVSPERALHNLSTRSNCFDRRD